MHLSTGRHFFVMNGNVSVMLSTDYLFFDEQFFNQGIEYVNELLPQQES